MLFNNAAIKLKTKGYINYLMAILNYQTVFCYTVNINYYSV